MTNPYVYRSGHINIRSTSATIYYGAISSNPPFAHAYDKDHRPNLHDDYHHPSSLDLIACGGPTWHISTTQTRSSFVAVSESDIGKRITFFGAFCFLGLLQTSGC